MARQPLADIRSFIIPLDGSDAAYGALAAACEVSRRSKADLLALHVIEVPRSLPVDAEMADAAQRGEAILDRADAIARESRVRLRADLLQARQAGHAVVDEAVERGTEALLVGVDYRRPRGRFALGRLPMYVLEHAPTLVWLLRYPQPAGVITTRPGTIWSR